MSLFRKKEKIDASAPATKASGDHNPYLNGRQEWLERYGSYISRAAQWRMTAFIALLLLGGSISGNVIQASQAKVIPYIIEVDQLGKAAVVARADRAAAPPARLIQAEIAACISDWRTVTADIELQKQMIQRLSFFVAGSAKGVLKEWFSLNNPYEIAKSGKLVHVEVKSLPLPVSSGSYRVEWTETVRSHAGVILDVHSYEATVGVQINPPASEAVLLHNPGGVYITSLSASRVFRSSGTTSSAKQ